MSRRAFLRAGAAAGAAALLPRVARASEAGPRHVLLEYYPWYRTRPFVHWDELGRVPPEDLASNHMPRLGAYDSLDRAVVEQHARWIAHTGATGINVSWWGPGSLEDQAVPLLMDVMRDHGLKVAFHLEPYGDERSHRYADDVLYLLREYGEKRRWDAYFLLRTAAGRVGPVFKSFRTILPPSFVDCRGVEHEVRDFTPDDTWRRQTDALRDTLRGDFDHLLLYADSLEFARTPRSGFDGAAIYDPFVDPADYRDLAMGASAAGLLSTFGVNPGYDAIEPRAIEGPCYTPPAFEPPPRKGTVTFDTDEGRELAARLSAHRIEASWNAAVKVQGDPALLNAQRGINLVYVVSFNEWHEGTSFEPMKDADALTRSERAIGYHNPRDGSYRLEALRRLVRG